MSLLGDISGNFSLLTGGAYFSKDFRKCTSGPIKRERSARDIFCVLVPVRDVPGALSALRSVSSIIFNPQPVMSLSSKELIGGKDTRTTRGAPNAHLLPSVAGEKRRCWRSEQLASLSLASSTGMPVLSVRPVKAREVRGLLSWISGPGLGF